MLFLNSLCKIKANKLLRISTSFDLETRNTFFPEWLYKDGTSQVNAEQPYISTG